MTRQGGGFTRGMTRLRDGFTTGTAATAAALAALAHMLGCPAAATVRTPLPPFTGEPPQPAGWMDIPVRPARALCSRDGALAVVQKDAGDDPDVTHNALIVAAVWKGSEGGGAVAAPNAQESIGVPPDGITIEGGHGVGRVTLPGLPVPVGAPAINPAPQAQIRYALRHLAAQHGYTGPLHVRVSVPMGVRLARRTFNPRLGIVGGISILGTQGTVRPYSHDAWRTAVLQAINVAAATGCETLYLCTGRRSETLLRASAPALPAQACVQIADFAQAACEAAGQQPFRHVVWGGFFGKLVKLAQGHGHTHAHTAQLDFALLDQWRREAGVAATVAHCVTASHALEILLEDARGLDAVAAIARRAAAVLANFAGRPVGVHVFHINGRELVRL